MAGCIVLYDLPGSHPDVNGSILILNELNLKQFNLTNLVSIDVGGSLEIVDSQGLDLFSAAVSSLDGSCLFQNTSLSSINLSTLLKLQGTLNFTARGGVGRIENQVSSVYYVFSRPDFRFSLTPLAHTHIH